MHYPLPFTLGIAAGFAYALWGECHQRQRDVKSSSGVLYGYLLSICAAFLPAWVRLHELDTSPGELAKALCNGLAHIAAYLTLVAAFARIPAFIALVVASAEVPLVALVAALLAGERQGALTLLGGALIVAANVQVTMWGRKGT